MQAARPLQPPPPIPLIKEERAASTSVGSSDLGHSSLHSCQPSKFGGCIPKKKGCPGGKSTHTVCPPSRTACLLVSHSDKENAAFTGPGSALARPSRLDQPLPVFAPPRSTELTNPTPFMYNQNCRDAKNTESCVSSSASLSLSEGRVTVVPSSAIKREK